MVEDDEFIVLTWSGQPPPPTQRPAQFNKTQISCIKQPHEVTQVRNFFCTKEGLQAGILIGQFSAAWPAFRLGLGLWQITTEHCLPRP
jgi:hypothetical protein